MAPISSTVAPGSPVSGSFVSTGQSQAFKPEAGGYVRLLVYGTMGGEGQPQTQAAVFSRYVWGGHNVRSAVAAPRWLRCFRLG